MSETPPSASQPATRPTAYARRFIASVLGVRGVDVDVGLEEAIIYELSRGPESASPRRDQWGNWEWSFADAQRRGDLYRPWLDEPLAELRARLRAQHPGWPWQPTWPDGRPFALCLTHDVDLVSSRSTLRTTARELRQLRRAAAGLCELTRHSLTAMIRLGQSAGCGADPLWHYEDWLKLEDHFGFRSSFYFFPSRLARPAIWDCTYHHEDQIHFAGRRMSVSAMMRAIHEAGWDVGLHGSYSSATEPGLLRDERAQIEAILGSGIVSTRQHWLHYEARLTPRLQAEAGLRCDSTQGFNRSIGFRAGTAFPYWCWDERAQAELPVLEIPQHIMDGALFGANALEYDADLAITHCVELMDRVEQIGGCLTLSWHPNYLNDHPWWPVYRTLLEEGARRSAWGCSAGQLYAWWTTRESRLISVTRD